MRKPNAPSREPEFDHRRYVADPEYRARYDAQSRQKSSPETRALFENMKRQAEDREAWIRAGMKQERREELARRLRFFPPDRNASAPVISIATRQPI